MVDANQSLEESKHIRKISERRIGSIIGVLLCASSIALVILSILYLDYPQAGTESVEPFTWFVRSAPALLLIAFAFVVFSNAIRLIANSQRTSETVIPPEDRPLIEDRVKENKDIDQYVRLRSLTGITGFFTKIGPTGLPLTTVVLTIIFSLFYIGFELFPNSESSSFLDLAKLTLGAFIGSYVQKGQDYNFQWFNTLLERNQRESQNPSPPPRSTD